MTEKIEQYEQFKKELDSLVKSINIYYEEWTHAGNDYTNGINKYLKKLNDYIDVVYGKGLNDAWECVKKIVDMDWNTRHEVLNDSNMTLYGLLSDFTPEKAIKRIKEYEEDKNRVTRCSIIKTKLDEIKDMFEDPVTNEELIEILEEEGDN